MGGDHHIILRVVARALMPIIALYGFYVHFHGEYSPGGGFQGGVILTVSVILYALVFGVAEAMRAITPGFARFIAAFGVFLYVATGVCAIAMGGNFLDYDALAPADGESRGTLGQHIGIIMVELGVLCAVAGSMTAIFYAFAGRVSEIRDEDW